MRIFRGVYPYTCGACCAIGETGVRVMKIKIVGGGINAPMFVFKRKFVDNIQQLAT